MKAYVRIVQPRLEFIGQLWRKLRFMAYDLPAQGGAFNERIAFLNDVVRKINRPWV